jgi:HEAT repeat protein
MLIRRFITAVLLFVGVMFFFVSESGDAAAAGSGKAGPTLDLAQLREVLQDRQDPRGQNQAALMLVQSRDPAAEKIVRRGLLQPDNEEMFLALTTAIRLEQDNRFLDELLEALRANKPRLRQSIAEALAALTSSSLVPRLEKIVANGKEELRVRQTAIWALGRTGRKEAAGALVGLVGSANEDLARIAVGALTDLSGQALGLDRERWRAWWASHRNLTDEQWLKMRLTYQTSRAQRLEGDLMRARTQVIRLHQQLYLQLPVAERFVYLQRLLEQDDPGVRSLAIGWGLELLPAAADSKRQGVLSKVLVQLTHDSSFDVQRAAVLSLGRLSDRSPLDVE